MLSTPAAAQTPVSVLNWKYVGESATEVNTNYVQVVTLNSAVITTPTLRPTCVQAGADVNCSIPIGTPGPGPHTVTVSATKNNITATTTINNLTLGPAPKNPTDFRYQINITVNVP